MNCCQCQGIETLFNQKLADRELKDYRRNGPDKTTRILLSALPSGDLSGWSLLDIGGGVGAIQHILAKRGVSHITSVDAAQAYLASARKEALRLDYADRATYYHGDFVALAPQVEAADIVTLNRVLCCYHDVERLVDRSVARAKRLYALIYPRDTWLLKLFRPFFNSYFWLTRNPYRFFVHPTPTVEAIIGRHGLKRRFLQTTLVWQIVVYERHQSLYY